MCAEGLRTSTMYRVALYINKSQAMALSVGANITRLNHTLQQLITHLALYKPGKVPKTQNFSCLHQLLVQYNRKTQQHSIICTGVVGLTLPVAWTLN